MKKIFILTDYKEIFGSKWNVVPYRSGMDLKLLTKQFEKHGFDVKILTFAEAANSDLIKKDNFIIYTSTEDDGYYYKSFIEDVIYYLEHIGAIIIPSYIYLKATNNKVFMELLRKKLIDPRNNILDTKVYGTLEEAGRDIDKFHFPLVVKKAQGAMSKGVMLAKNKQNFAETVAGISRTKNFLKEIKDKLRPYKHKGYIRESKNRGKFITQNMIPDLRNDFKVLVFGNKYFIFSRPVRKNDFRASGSGSQNYSYGSKCNYPLRIFDFAKKIFDQFNTPHLSIDIAFDGNDFYLFEFQGVHFGTVGCMKSDVFFIKEDNHWEQKENSDSLESIFADCINSFITENR